MHKTYKQWQESNLNMTQFLQVGDTVDEEFYYYALEVVPPAYMAYGLLQIGEAYDHVKGRPIYTTFVERCGQYQFCGHCYRGDLSLKDLTTEGYGAKILCTKE